MTVLPPKIKNSMIIDTYASDHKVREKRERESLSDLSLKKKRKKKNIKEELREKE
jgi:hypothetical protein